MSNNQETPEINGVTQKTKNALLAPVKSKGVLISVGIILLCLIGLIFVNYFSLIKTRQELQNYSEITANLENELKTISKRSPLVSSWRSFGDNFSSQAYIATDGTDMFFDEKVTAFSFPPAYNFESVSGCDDEICGLSPSSLVLVNNNKAQQPETIPSELKGKKIVYSSLDKLTNLKVASYIVAEGDEERAYVYFFDGRKFSSIIDKDTVESIVTKYSRGGGTIKASGDDNDFLILYIGYEGLGFHYKNNKLTNISNFFGLRVADNGFSPYIIKQGKGNNTTWYVLSLNANKPKLIKLWQNNSEKIVGAHDFSNILNNTDGTLVSFASGKNPQEIKFVFKRGGSSGMNAPAQILIPGASSQTETSALPDSLPPFELKVFTDKGFDNSVDRSIVSVNLNEAQGFVTKAKINDVGLNGQANLFLSNSNEIFVETKPDQETEFSLSGRDLFWRADFPKSDDNQYSPWFDNINYLDYYLQVN